MDSEEHLENMENLPAKDALNVMFDSFEQTVGFNITFFDMRVRKKPLNRTTAALNGTVYIIQWVGKEVQFKMDLFHSPLGNQQFNYYPMKLPTCDLCAFIDQMHTNYKDEVASFENLPAKGECPISPRPVLVRDYIFPSDAIPPVVPRGLWKAVMTGTRQGNHNPETSYTVVVKVYDF